MKGLSKAIQMAITVEHIYFIPSVLILGIAIGFLLGQSRKIPSTPTPPSKFE